ncbi:S9 family peptidase [Dysgonomonas sp. Marseille-P4677]|uniref:alpha/beta hydrolase family protein n=1 Tax=Dysgonomonas sp. Marseille-P4677 TaxID=2364790 RepID=UPI001911E33E|nr:alpha/beta fold hydrolase [Dysgonomonas sp. Marseille-P4677]
MKCRVVFLLLFLILSGEFCLLKAIKPDRTYRFYPEKLGLIYKELDVITKDNLKIKTWFFPAQNALSKEESDRAWVENRKREYKLLNDEKRPTLIICDSDAGNMSWIHLHLAQEITKLGVNVVTFDWRDFGESSEWNMDTNYMCYTEMLWDYDAVINEVAKEDVVDTSRIGLMGWSTGSYLSMIAAYNSSFVSAYIGIATPSSFEEVMPIIKKVQNKKDEEVIIPKDFPSHQMPVYIAPDFNKSTFLIVGDKDDRTLPYMSEDIYNALPENIIKNIWIIEGADHGGLNGPITLNFECFIDRINEFIKTAFN